MLAKTRGPSCLYCLYSIAILYAYPSQQHDRHQQTTVPIAQQPRSQGGALVGQAPGQEYMHRLLPVRQALPQPSKQGKADVGINIPQSTLLHGTQQPVGQFCFQRGCSKSAMLATWRPSSKLPIRMGDTTAGNRRILKYWKGNTPQLQATWLISRSRKTCE